MKPQIRLVYRMPDRQIVGRVASVRLEIMNQSLLPAYDLSVGFFSLPSSIREIDGNRYVKRLGPGESTAYEVYLKPSQRGLYELEIPQYFSTFPFNLFRMGPRIHDKTSVLVSVLVCPNYRSHGVYPTATPIFTLSTR